MKTQKCKKCGVTKSIEQFGFNLKRGDKYRKSQCKSCESEYRRQWAKKTEYAPPKSTPETLKESRERYWKNMSGKDLTAHIDKYNAKIEALAGKQEKYQEIIDLIEDILDSRQVFKGAE